MSTSNTNISGTILPTLTGDSSNDQEEIRHALLSMTSSIQSVQNSSQSGLDSQSIDSGTNSYGSWIKFPDGNMISWGVWANSLGTLGSNTNFFGTTSGITYHRVYTVVFPKQFKIYESIVSSGAYPTSWESPTINGFTSIVYGGTDPSGYNTTWIAMGTWK